MTVATWILIIAGVLLVVAAFRFKMGRVFRVLLVVVGVLVLLVGITGFLPAKPVPATPPATVSGPAPGGGTTDADKLFAAASPKIRETVYSPNPEDTATYLWDRITASANSMEALRFTEKDTASADKVTTSITLTFADGSSLTLNDSPIGPSQGLRLDGVTIARP